MSTLYVDNLQPNLGSRVEIPSLKPIAGSVVQVVQVDDAEFSTRFTTTSSSYVSSGYDLVITPTSTSSKILITCNFSVHSTSGYAYGLIARNGTQLANTQFAFGGGGQPWGMAGSTFLDEPNSTSAVTYTLYGFTNSGTAYYGWNSSTTNNNFCYFIAQEIAQ